MTTFGDLLMVLLPAVAQARTCTVTEERIELLEEAPRLAEDRFELLETRNMELLSRNRPSCGTFLSTCELDHWLATRMACPI